MRYLADMISGMAVGLSKSGRMTLRHLTHASTTMAAEKWTRLVTPSSKPLGREKGGVARVGWCAVCVCGDSPANVSQCGYDNGVHFLHGWLQHTHTTARERERETENEREQGGSRCSHDPV